ncbi:uncharacterized protein DS421_4g122530 [Arachis hypogaea]|nr:uncharacterized protein DS421_4g122530 [Arachis hypogaea]
MEPYSAPSSCSPRRRCRREEKDAREGGARPAARGHAWLLLLKPAIIVAVDEDTNDATVRRLKGISSPPFLSLPMSTKGEIGVHRDERRDGEDKGS